MPMPVTNRPKTQRITASATVRANVGRFEHIEFTLTEEVTIENNANIADVRKVLLESLQDSLVEAGARFVEPLECSSMGANPAGQVACLFKNVSDNKESK